MNPRSDVDAHWEAVSGGWWLYTKSDGTGYVVNGFCLHCSCFGYRKWRHCKHIDWIKESYDEQKRNRARSDDQRRRAA